MADLSFLKHMSCVAIDDNPAELKALCDALMRGGIRPFSVDFSSPDAALKLVEGCDLSGVKIVFLDLNLIPTVGSGKGADRLNKSVMSALKLQGPYMLVVWSGNPGKARESMEVIFDEKSNVPIPVAYALLDKADYIAGDAFDSVELFKAIQKLLEKFPQLLALLAWQAQVADSADAVLGFIFGALDPVSAESFLTTLKEKGEKAHKGVVNCDSTMLAGILRKIAAADAGQRLRNDEARSACRSLMTLLEDRILDPLNAMEEDNTTWKRSFKDAPLPPQKLGLLNSAFVVESLLKVPEPSGNTAFIPGLACLNSDPPCIGAVFAGSLQQACAAFFSIESGKTSTCIVNPSDKRDRVQLADVLRDLKFGLVHHIPACDFAQKKAVSSTAFLACLIPAKWLKYALNKTEAIYRLYNISVDGELMNLFFSFLYVSRVKAKPCDACLADCRALRIKRQVLQDLGVRYGNYTARLGLMNLG